MRIRTIAVILLIWIKLMIISAEYCFDPNISDPRGGKVVNCALVTDLKSLLKNQKYIKSPAILSSNRNVNMFETTLHCSSTEEICTKVKEAFDSAGEILSSTINFVEKIKVNATFTPLCDKEKGNCEDDEILGSAGPIRFHPMIDDDNMVRLYPQSLVKQFQYHTHLEYSQYDIGAIFNSNAKYWFGGEINIEKNQFDFLYIILHELIHGLGFGSSWDQYYVGLITPPIINSFNSVNINVESNNNNDDDDYNNNKEKSVKFVEWAFDKHVILMGNGTKISSITQELNEFFNPESLNNLKINTQRDFEINFHNSKQFIIAKQMFNLAQTPNTIGFLSKGKDDDNNKNIKDLDKNIVILETSFNPFRVASSISHIDNSLYSNTEDFLMRPVIMNGVTLQQEIVNGGNYSGGPIGPKLKQILETLGYSTKDNPASYRPRVVNPASIDTSIAAPLFANNIYLEIVFALLITYAFHFLI
ncbi:hypothetical protein RclHR1_02480012 [Rhizophagus clarus]|uniref:Sequence orphan n=1 Tax=Rhizophagus clarus TaxID=94130 RepID=A0A2Z6QY39_9GLOM|nr:hypothetical protein RclHR1_02480012 [Rhizophagus clarus]GET02848.1 hypothetical protein GLOIN_2v1484843 [Rhizophagus clarus]